MPRALSSVLATLGHYSMHTIIVCMHTSANDPKPLREVYAFCIHTVNLVSMECDTVNYVFNLVFFH